MGIREEVEDMKKEVQAVKEQSFAMELLSDQRKQNKRLYTIILVILAMWFATIGYLVYVLNDIGTETITEETYDMTQDIDGIDTINGDVINRGK